MTVTPIGAASARGECSAEEWQLRVDLAACYRLVALYGWADLVFTHVSARIPGPEHHFLINPYGMLFDEITASSLVRVDQSGSKVTASPYPVNPAGFSIHSAIHQARPDVACVLHSHTRAGVAVAAQREGLLPISQQASVALSSLAYHDYEGLAMRPDEQPRLQADLGGKFLLILRNHGLLTLGATIADAFLNMYVLESACQIQVAAQGGGPLIPIAPEVVAFNARVARDVLVGAGAQIAWPALLRKLDRIDPSYKS